MIGSDVTNSFPDLVSFCDSSQLKDYRIIKTKALFFLYVLIVKKQLMACPNNVKIITLFYNILLSCLNALEIIAIVVGGSHKVLAFYLEQYQLH